MNEPIKTRTLFNPTSEDLEFMWNSAIYRVKAGQRSEPLLEHIAIHGAKKLADKNIKTNNPAEHEVLMRAYVEESSVEKVAEFLGVNLEKIRTEAMTKEKEKAKVKNLEYQVSQMAEEMRKIKENMQPQVGTPQEVKVGTPQDVEIESQKVEETSADELNWKELRGKAAELEIEGYLKMKKDELKKAVEDKMKQ